MILRRDIRDNRECPRRTWNKTERFRSKMQGPIVSPPLVSHRGDEVDSPPTEISPLEEDEGRG
jgi:hypothetical protein